MSTELQWEKQKRKDAEELIRRQAQILDQVHDAVISTDLSGIIQSWNPAAERIYGWSAAEVVGRHIEVLYFDEDRHLIDSAILAPLQSEGIHELIVRTRHKSGRPIDVSLRLSLLRDDSGQPVGAIGCSNDITERKRAKEALRRERDFAEGIIQTAQAIVVVLDCDGRIVRFNPFMERLSGYRLEDVQGCDWFHTCLPQEDRRPIRELFQQALGRVETKGQINPIVTKDGVLRRISWWDRTLVDGEGNVLGLLCIGHDITDLLEAQQRALRSERLAAIGQTITTIGHECRNEFLALGVGLDLLEENVADHAKQLKMINLMRESHSRLRHLFEDLRGFAAPIKLRCSDCDLAELWRLAWASLQHQRAGRRAELNERVEAVRLIGHFDALRIEQVFRNLFENALAACPDPVQIDISVSEEERDGNHFLRIAIHDNGPGLAAAERDKVFDPFYSTKQEGTGLGLAIVRHIVIAHGGSVVAADTDRPGAEFVITLPRTR